MNYDNTNKGVLFKNDDKLEKAATHDTSKWPDYQGKINVGGHEYDLSAWVRKSQSGKMFMSLALKGQSERTSKPKAAAPPPPAPPPDFDDDIPF